MQQSGSGKAGWNSSAPVPPLSNESSNETHLVHQMACRMKSDLVIRDRLWRDLRVYKASFLGTEAMAWLERETGDREEGLRWGNSMIQLGLCRHVCNAHYFEGGSKTLYYVWNDEVLRDTDTRENLAHLTRHIERLDAENGKLSSELTETLFRQALVEEQLHLVEMYVKFALASALVGMWFDSGRAGEGLRGAKR